MGNTQTDTIRNHFFDPLDLALSRAKYTRASDKYSDELHLRCGVGRVIQASNSGREWIQYYTSIINTAVSVSNFFDALRSDRRLTLLEEVALDVEKQARQQIRAHNDPFACHEELHNFEIYASDGHCHGASAHEEKIGDKKRPVTHLFSLNLRTHTLSHLALTQPTNGKKKEHEITAVKRIGAKALRMGTPTGIKVIQVYDPAIIDYPHWQKWKQSYGVYIITKEKKNSRLMTLGEMQWDENDPRNTGVLSDEWVGPSNGYAMRRIRYQDPVSGEEYSFITTEVNLPPGLIAYLYKLRWDVEKVFDDVKNKLCQKKAWGKYDTAKQQQALFITIAYNLMLILENNLETQEGITDEKARKKRAQRLAEDIQKAQNAGRKPNPLVWSIDRSTQRSMQFIRWLKMNIMLNTLWKEALATVRPLMTHYLS